MTRLETLHTHLISQFGDALVLTNALDELTIDVPVEQWVDACTQLRDQASLGFDTLIDLCGVDYSTYGQPAFMRQPEAFPQRFAAVVHLLSVKHNWRLRVRTFVPNEEFPLLQSLVDVWPNVNWFEREAFDLYGLVFDGHPDLRRILTDYGFIGHPFRKDFPLSGTVEMRYDTEQKRVIYQPVTIEPREVTPRVVREDGYGIER